MNSYSSSLESFSFQTKAILNLRKQMRTKLSKKSFRLNLGRRILKLIVIVCRISCKSPNKTTKHSNNTSLEAATMTLLRLYYAKMMSK